jgi:hypothetical protein
MAWLVLFLAVAQLLAPSLPRLTGLGQSIEARTDTVYSPETPIGGAFAIWFVIFLLALVYGVAQVRWQKDPCLSAVRLPAALAFFLSSAWMLVAQLTEGGWLLVALILAMGLATLNGLFQLQTATGPWVNKLLQPLFGLFAGWLTVAMFLNLYSVAQEQWGPFTMASGLLPLVGGVGLACWVSRRLQHRFWYGLAVYWALLGVLLKNTLEVLNPLFALSAVVLALIVFWAQRQRIAAT